MEGTEAHEIPETPEKEQVSLDSEVEGPEVEDLKDEITERLVAMVPGELGRIHEYAGEALDLKEELRFKMSELPPREFEQVLRPIFQEDEGTAAGMPEEKTPLPM